MGILEKCQLSSSTYLIHVICVIPFAGDALGEVDHNAVADSAASEFPNSGMDKLEPFFQTIEIYSLISLQLDNFNNITV